MVRRQFREPQPVGGPDDQIPRRRIYGGIEQPCIHVGGEEDDAGVTFPQRLQYQQLVVEVVAEYSDSHRRRRIGSLSQTLRQAPNVIESGYAEGLFESAAWKRWNSPLTPRGVCAVLHRVVPAGTRAAPVLLVRRRHFTVDAPEVSVLGYLDLTFVPAADLPGGMCGDIVEQSPVQGVLFRHDRHRRPFAGRGAGAAIHQFPQNGLQDLTVVGDGRIERCHAQFLAVGVARHFGAVRGGRSADQPPDGNRGLVREDAQGASCLLGGSFEGVDDLQFLQFPDPPRDILEKTAGAAGSGPAGCVLLANPASLATTGPARCLGRDFPEKTLDRRRHLPGFFVEHLPENIRTRRPQHHGGRLADGSRLAGIRMPRIVQRRDERGDLVQGMLVEVLGVQPEHLNRRPTAPYGLRVPCVRLVPDEHLVVERIGCRRGGRGGGDVLEPRGAKIAQARPVARHELLSRQGGHDSVPLAAALFAAVGIRLGRWHDDQTEDALIVVLLVPVRFRRVDKRRGNEGNGLPLLFVVSDGAPVLVDDVQRVLPQLCEREPRVLRRFQAGRRIRRALRLQRRIEVLNAAQRDRRHGDRDDRGPGRCVLGLGDHRSSLRASHIVEESTRRPMGGRRAGDQDHRLALAVAPRRSANRPAAPERGRGLRRPRSCKPT